MNKPERKVETEPGQEHNFPWPRLSTDRSADDTGFATRSDIAYEYHAELRNGWSFAKEELTLPPMLPESEFGPDVAPNEREAVEKRRSDLAQYDLSRLTPGAKRLHDLPKRVWSAIIYARKNTDSSKEMSRIEHALYKEINAALKPLSRFARSFVHCNYEMLDKFVKGYMHWVRNLNELFSEEFMPTPRFPVYYRHFVELELDMVALYIRARTMAMIEAAHNESGIFISDFISVTVERGREHEGDETDNGSEGKQKPTDGEWSKPMSKSKMMAALGLDSYKTLNAFAKNYGIREAGNRQTFQIRLDTMDVKTRQKLEKV